MLGGRIQALARAHDQITNLNWAPVALRSLRRIRGRRLSRRARRPRQDGRARRRARSQGVRDAGAGRARDDDQFRQIRRARRFHRPGRGGVAARSVVEPRHRLEGERRSAGAAAVAPRLRHHHHRALRPVRPQGRSRNPLRPAGGAGDVHHSRPISSNSCPSIAGAAMRIRRTAIRSSADFRHGADRRGQSDHRHGRRGHPARSRRPPCRHRRERRPGAAGDRAHAARASRCSISTSATRAASGWRRS